eukprot:9526711-Prorocentrum_lima.AAC.1
MGVAKHKPKAVRFWSDCGPHFRNYVALSSLGMTALQKYPDLPETSWSFTLEKHGKGRCGA